MSEHDRAQFNRIVELIEQDGYRVVEEKYHSDDEELSFELELTVIPSGRHLGDSD